MSRPADSRTPAVPISPAVLPVLWAGLTIAGAPLAVAPLAAVGGGGRAVGAPGALCALSRGHQQHRQQEEQWQGQGQGGHL